MCALCLDRAHSAVSWCTGRRVVALPGRVAACTGSVVGLPVTIQKSYRDSILAARTARLVARRWAPYRNPRRAVSRHQACPSCHDTIVCIVTHLASHAPRALAAARPCALADRVVALLVVSWGRVAGLLAVSWPPCCTPLPSCVTIQFVVS